MSGTSSVLTLSVVTGMGAKYLYPVSGRAPPAIVGGAACTRPLILT